MDRRSLPLFSSADSDAASPETRDYTLSPRERRVLGVLIEKAKTVPDSYPMTINGIVTGCNQKSNRNPQMTLTEDQAEEAVDSLRARGLVVEIQGNGRVVKYKHQAYDWFGASKVELAVLAELLLRGEQTLGDLRARTSRMEPIADLGEMQRIVGELVGRGLMQALTPAGRGQVVSHAMYLPEEQAELGAQVEFAPSGASSESPIASRPASAAVNVSASVSSNELESLRRTVEALADRLQVVEDKLESLLG